MSNTPKISIIMSMFNTNEKYLKESLDSIFSQTLEDFEFIIIDDCSTERRNIEIVESYNDPRVILIKNTENRGLTKNLNTAIKMAKADFVARMDDDDVAMPTRLERQYEELTRSDNLVLVGTWGHLIDEHGTYLQDIKAPPTSQDILTEIFSQNTFIHSSVCFRKSFIEKLGYYDETVKKSQDYDLWLRIIFNKGLTANIPEFLIKYRTHSKSISVMTKDEQEGFVNKIMQNNFSKFIGEDINENTIKNLRKVKFYGQKLNSISELGEVVGLYKKLMRSFKELYPEYPNVTKNIESILKYLVNFQIENKIIREVFKVAYGV